MSVEFFLWLEKIRKKTTKHFGSRIDWLAINEGYYYTYRFSQLRQKPIWLFHLFSSWNNNTFYFNFIWFERKEEKISFLEKTNHIKLHWKEKKKWSSVLSNGCQCNYLYDGEIIKRLAEQNEREKENIFTDH